MSFRAVIFDIGGVLELVDELDLADRWERRLDLAPGHIAERTADLWLAGSIGTMTESAVRDAISQRLGIELHTADDILADMWRQYLGVANDELISYTRSLRPRYKTGIISNSFVGAREREQDAYGFEDLVDDIIYSHEVGIAKPDPRIYALACDRLGVTFDQVIFIDDAQIAPIRRVYQPEPEPPDPVLARMVPITICASPDIEPRNSTVSSNFLLPVVRPSREPSPATV